MFFIMQFKVYDENLVGSTQHYRPNIPSFLTLTLLSIHNFLHQLTSNWKVHLHLCIPTVNFT